MTLYNSKTQDTRSLPKEFGISLQLHRPIANHLLQSRTATTTTPCASTLQNINSSYMPSMGGQSVYLRKKEQRLINQYFPLHSNKGGRIEDHIVQDQDTHHPKINLA